jgi:hypothetical protein
VNQASEALCLLLKVPQVFPVMDFKDEAWPAVHGALNNVLRQAGKIEARRSGHEKSMPCVTVRKL